MEPQVFSTLTHAGLIKKRRFSKKFAFGSRRDAFLILLISLFANIGAVDYTYSFISPTRHTSYDVLDSGAYAHYLKLNLTHSMENSSSCTMILTKPDNSQQNYSLNVIENNCFGNATLSLLGNYSFILAVGDAIGNSFQTTPEWTVGQWCDTELSASLKLAGNLDANLLQTNYCLDMVAPNVILDCNGFDITAVSGAIDYAIRLGGANSVVKNCNFKGPFPNAYILISDFLGGNQSNFSIINNTFDSANVPGYGDIITDFGSTENANYTLISGNTFSHSAIISGNMLYLDFIGNVFSSGSKVATETIAGGLPNALLFEERGNGAGSRNYWRMEGNIFNAVGSDSGSGGGCISVAENTLGGSHITDFINNACLTDVSTTQIYHAGGASQGNLSIINSTFSPNGLSGWENNGAGIFTNVYWWVELNITNATSPLENAVVAYYDASGALMASGLTNSQGIASFLVQEAVHIDNSPTDIYKTPHMFSANLSGYNASAVNSTINSSKTISIQLAQAIIVAPTPTPTTAPLATQSQSSGSSSGGRVEQKEIEKASPKPAENPPTAKTEKEAPPTPNAKGFQALVTDISESLFDIVVLVLEKNIKIGDNPTAKISLTKFNKPGLLPVDLHYEIRTKSGDLVSAEDEKVIVDVNFDFLKTLPLPPGIRPGDYSYYAKVTYEGGKIAESSDAFKLEGGKNASGAGIGETAGLLAVPAIGVIAFIAGIRLMRRKVDAFEAK
ncbi:hypothetical protein HY989_00610 [Candidatus Micrarchaeota archaeon]|nr:hypothetical protein [Candidatus Micrarchaeota archaeon]